MSGITGIMTGGSQGAATKCADVGITPDGGSTPISVNLSTVTSTAHIFYTVNTDIGIDPQHSGDSAIAPTIRIGSNSGTISVNAPPSHTKVVRALAYAPGLLDSDINEGNYDGPEIP